MHYSPSSGIAYYHIHKTGGTSFREFLGGVLPDLEGVDPWAHYPLAHYFPLLRQRGVDPDGLKILSTVRDPFEHVVSVYHYWRARGDLRNEWVLAALNSTFGEFVRFYVTSPVVRVFDEDLFVNGALPPNVRLLRLENLAAEADRVLNGEWGLGVPVAIPHLNRCHHGPAAAHYDEATARFVRDRYAWVFRQGLYPDLPSRVSER
jgi:hypothetical protein